MIQVEWHFAEPADVWANSATAFAAWKLDWRIVCVRVSKWRAAASVAVAAEEFAVHMDDALRPCLRRGVRAASALCGTGDDAAMSRLIGEPPADPLAL